MFFALYLFIAFFSYLFTWRADFDNVYNFPWRVLLDSEIVMENWLGRLGAIVSNAFFFWGFGMPSFVFVFLLGLFGWASVKREPYKVHMPLLRQSFLWVLFLSVFLEFVFRNSQFPWGGAFGESVCTWMENFVGTIGMVVLFFFIIFGFVIWQINPNFIDLTPRKAVSEIKHWLNDLVNRRYRSRRTSQTASSTSNST